jgi:preprotein translocase subunit YajC
MQEFALLAFLMLLGMGVWWSMITFPKQRTFQKRQEFARSLAQGDEVITYGGIIGKVVDIDAELGIAHVEIADGVIIRVLNAAMVQPYDVQGIARNAQMGLTGSTSDDSKEAKDD